MNLLKLSACFFSSHRADQAFDLTPPAEMDDVAQLAAAAGAQLGFDTGAFAKFVDKVRCIRKGGAAGAKNLMIQSSPRKELCSAS